MKKFSGISVAVAVLAAATLAGCPVPPDPMTASLAAGDLSTALNGKSVYFDANATGVSAEQFYNRIVSSVTGFPVSPVGQQAIDFAANDPFPVTLPAGSPVMYYGQPYTALFIGSDGTVSLGTAGAGNATLQDHFSSTQVSVLPLDFSADAEAGVVSQQLYTDSFVVTYSEVNGSSAQIEFFMGGDMDEDINVAYPAVSASLAGVVGLSNNQLASNANFLSGFVNSDLGSTNTDSAS